MNDIRRTVLWVIFGFSIILLWDQWQLSQGKQPTFFPTANPALVAGTPGLEATKGSGVSSETAKASSLNTTAGVPIPLAATTATGGVPTVNSTVVPGAALATALPRQKTTITTDVAEYVFDSEGGSLVRSAFKKYRDSSNPDQNFVLFDESSNRIYMSQTGLIANGATLPTHKTPMTPLPGERTLAEGQNELQLRFESAEVGGVKLVKTYTFNRSSYAIGVRHDVVNVGSTAVAPQLYFQLVRDGNKPPGESAFYSTFTGPAVYTEAQKYQKVEFKDIENNKVDVEKQATNGYISMVQHYFASAWLLGDGIRRDLFLRKVDTNLYAVGMIAQMQSVAPGTTLSMESRLFAGPQEEKLLETLTPGLELVKDYGWLTILAKPLYWLLDKLHSFIGNWGWSIVALVLLLKIAFYWLNAKAYASMAKMKAVNPKIMEMRERLKDKPQEMQQAMMKIYRDEKVNPMGGCFPIMVQIPVFIALYWVLLSSVEMRNAPWILWIRDLSTPDPFYILPVIMAATTMLQTALNPAPPDPLQAKLMWYMPLIFSVMFFFFPSGLVLYWITNNILSIAQQWVINTRMGVPPQFNLPKFR